MQVKAAPPDKRFFHILKKYAAGEISPADAAYEIQEMNLDGNDDPSATEVVLWSKAAGFGIPQVSKEEAEEEAARILRKMKDAEKK